MHSVGQILAGIAGVVLLSVLLVACASGGTAVLTPIQASTASSDIAKAQAAVSAASAVVELAVAAGELPVPTATEAQKVIADVQTALTAASVAVEAGSSADVSTELAGVETLLTDLKMAAPGQAAVIGQVQAVVTAMQALHPAG